MQILCKVRKLNKTIMFFKVYYNIVVVGTYFEFNSHYLERINVVDCYGVAI